MTVVSKFEGRRSRGIVWVCDIANSSKYLNSNESAEELESFLQRFLFVSMIFVEAAGGTFIKWTGDGFLAWFETPLHRDIGDIAFRALRAAWTLTLWVNVSQLGVTAPVKFQIRHAFTFEHDALVIDLTYADKNATDVLGRAVVLAFRLSSIKAEFPGIVTHGELLKHTKDTAIQFRKLKLSKNDRLKFFKDETWGTRDIFVSGRKFQRALSLRTMLSRTQELVDAIDRGNFKSLHTQFATKLVNEMISGPEWCREVLRTMDDYLKNDLLGSLKQVIPVLKQAAITSSAKSEGH